MRDSESAEFSLVTTVMEIPQVWTITAQQLQYNLDKKSTHHSKRQVGVEELKRAIADLANIPHPFPTIPQSPQRLSPLMFDSQPGTPKLPFERIRPIPTNIPTSAVNETGRCIEYSTAITLNSECEMHSFMHVRKKKVKAVGKRQLKVRIVNPILRHLNEPEATVVSGWSGQGRWSEYKRRNVSPLTAAEDERNAKTERSNGSLLSIRISPRQSASGLFPRNSLTPQRHPISKVPISLSPITIRPKRVSPQTLSFRL